MKMYIFEPESFGQQYQVLAALPQNALSYLIFHLEEESKKGQYEMDKYFEWKNSLVDNLPNGYTIHGYEEGAGGSSFMFRNSIYLDRLIIIIYPFMEFTFETRCATRNQRNESRNVKFSKKYSRKSF